MGQRGVNGCKWESKFCKRREEKMEEAPWTNQPRREGEGG